MPRLLSSQEKPLRESNELDPELRAAWFILSVDRSAHHSIFAGAAGDGPGDSPYSGTGRVGVGLAGGDLRLYSRRSERGTTAAPLGRQHVRRGRLRRSVRAVPNR